MSEARSSAVSKVQAWASRALKILSGRPPGAALLPADTPHAAVAGGWLVAAALTDAPPRPSTAAGPGVARSGGAPGRFGTGLLGLARSVAIVLVNA